MTITRDEFDGSLIDFRANRSQFSTGRPVFLREWLLAHRLKTISLWRTCISIADSIADYERRLFLELLVNTFMQISVERDDPNKSSALFYWLLFKYRWSHAVCPTDFSRNQLLCPKTLAKFPLFGDLIRSLARQQSRLSFTDVHFWTCKYMGRKTNACRFCSLTTQRSFLWFLKFVYLNVYSISWTLSLNNCLRKFTLKCGLTFPNTCW